MFVKIKSSLYSPYYAEACNELRRPSPRLSAWATQLRRNVATVANRWRYCADWTGPGIEPQTSRTDSVRFATELTAGFALCLYVCKLFYSYYVLMLCVFKQGASRLENFRVIRCSLFLSESKDLFFVRYFVERKNKLLLVTRFVSTLGEFLWLVVTEFSRQVSGLETQFSKSRLGLELQV